MEFYSEIDFDPILGINDGPSAELDRVANLSGRSVFLYNYCYYIKIVRRNEGHKQGSQVLNLNTGICETLNYDTRVNPVQAQLVVHRRKY